MRRAALVVLTASALEAQQTPMRPLWLVPRGDTVLVYVMRSQRPASGFVVYRSTSGGALQKRTASPVMRVREPAVAAGMMGPDLPMVMRGMRAVDESEMFRRLNRDPFAINLVTGLSRKAALALGRLHVDAPVQPGTEYEYRVVMTDAAGAETDSSLSGRVRVADVIPVAPTGLRVDARDAEAKATWSYPKYRGEARDFVIGFHVYRADGALGAFRRLTATPYIRNDEHAPNFVDSDLRNGGTYRYRVTAVDITGRESAPLVSELLAVKDRTPPLVPAEVTIVEGEGTVALSWRLALEPDIAGYHVERSTELAGKYVRLDRGMIPAENPQYTDSVPGAKRYFYRVIAVDASGNASEPSNAMTAVAQDRQGPDAPTNVVASVVSRRVALRWTASRARDVRGYVIYRADSASRLVRIVSEPVSRTQFVDSGYAHQGLQPGAGYTIEVAAVDSANNESPRVRAQVSIPDDEPPAPPTAFTADNVSGRYVEITWSASPALDVATYELTRVAGDSTLRLGRLDARARETRDTTVARGRRYVYRLVAIDTAGNRSAPVGDTVEFRDFTPPPTPRVVFARTTAAGVALNWQRVIAADLVGYHVYRSQLPTGVFTRVTTTPLVELTFTDRSGRAGLYYVVKAIDHSGNESKQSMVAEAPRP